jgi:hypothetical protein
MPFFRAFQHLLPRAEAWRLAPGKTIRAFFEGLANGVPSTVRLFVDLIWEDLLPNTTREIPEWERQYGIQQPADVEATQRADIDAAWKAQGDQDPHYLQTILQAAGFPVYVHDWWSSGPPYVARDPRNYTNQPLIGSTQCDDDGAECGEPDAYCNAQLANEPGYLVNENLTLRAPPAIPSDSSKWPFFVYIGDATFPNTVQISGMRRNEFERLLLKYAPTQLWIVTLIEYVQELTTEAGEHLTTEAGDTLILEY